MSAVNGQIFLRPENAALKTRKCPVCFQTTSVVDVCWNVIFEFSFLITPKLKLLPTLALKGLALKRIKVHCALKFVTGRHIRMVDYYYFFITIVVHCTLCVRNIWGLYPCTCCWVYQFNSATISHYFRLFTLSISRHSILLLFCCVGVSGDVSTWDINGKFCLKIGLCNKAAWFF